MFIVERYGAHAFVLLAHQPALRVVEVDDASRRGLELPILCSIEPQDAPLRAPTLPSELRARNFGQMNRLMPQNARRGASGVRASTRCTMLSVSSSCCSLSRNENLRAGSIYWLPSLAVSALVRTRPRSVPHCGSVRHMVPLQVPSTELRQIRLLLFVRAVKT